MDHPFQVGGTYANRKGSYEVVSMDDAHDRMLIRYLDTGEVQEVQLALQARIWANMDWEQQEEIRQAAVEDARHQKGYGEGFTGLAETDFKTSTEATTWRSRAGLAGRVARLLSEGTPYVFVSWAIDGWPLAYMTHHADYQMAAFEMGVRKAKFTIELDEHNAYYGFYIEKSGDGMDSTWDWLRFKPDLTSGKAATLIEKLESEHPVRLFGRVTDSSVDERFHFSDGLREGAESLWDETNPTQYPVSERLGVLNAVPDNKWAELYLLGIMPKQQALAAGIEVAEQMASVMHLMLPLYRESV